MDMITTKCVNGVIKAGDTVLSTPDDDFGCLVGCVKKIALAGTPEHDTDNETDDVYVDFLAFEYSKKRTREIEKNFCGLFSVKGSIEEYGLDETIMAPQCLIKIIDAGEAALNRLLDSGYNAACHCYGILSGLNTGIKIELEKNVMEALNHAVSGFKITRIINGEKTDIELSCQELSNAYYFSRNKNYREDIIGILKDKDSEDLYGYTLDEICADDILMSDIFQEYEKNREEYNMEWTEAAYEAIRDVLSESERSKQ